jgi:hypothetical protein
MPTKHKLIEIAKKSLREHKNPKILKVMYSTQKRNNTIVKRKVNLHLNTIIVTKWVTWLKFVDHQRKKEATIMQI